MGKNWVRTISVCFIALTVLLFFSPRAWGETVADTEALLDAQQAELYQKSGAEAMYDGLPSDTRELLQEAGVEEAAVSGGLDGEKLFRAISQMLRDKLYGPMKTLGVLLAVVILCRLASSFEHQELNDTASMVGALVCAAAIAVPMVQLIQSAKLVIESASVFLLASIPVYSALMIASGNLVTGGSYSFWTLLFGNAIPLFSASFLIPMLNIFLALSLSSAISRTNFQKLTASLYSCTKWVLILLVTAFTGVLSVQTLLNAQADAASAKAVKLIASSAIPIVGGAFGDALAAIQSSMQLVKSGVGAFGILASLCIFLPVLMETVLWILIAQAGEIAADMFEVPKLGAFLGVCASAAKLVLAAVLSTGAVSIVSAAVILFVRSGS